jgi:transposase
MFAGIDIASERHMLACLTDEGVPVGKPTVITEDAAGYAKLLAQLGSDSALVVMEATGHYWKNLFAVLVAAGHRAVVLNPLQAKRFQEVGLSRTKTDAIDATGLARFGFEKRPLPSVIHDKTVEDLRALVQHRDRLRQDWGDRLRQLHRLVDLTFPELTKHITLDSDLALALLKQYPDAKAFAAAEISTMAKICYDGRHCVGEARAAKLIEAAQQSVGQHHGPVYALQARHLCEDLVMSRARVAAIDKEIEQKLKQHQVGMLLTSIPGVAVQTAARIIAFAGDPARFKSANAFAAYIGIVPGLRQSGKKTGRQASISPFGHAGLRHALWMPVICAIKNNPWLKSFYDRLRAAGKPAKVALIAAMRKLAHAIYSVAKNRKKFEIKQDHVEA